MAGTDSTRSHAATADRRAGPAIILVEPQLGENIGAVARAMLNCGLSDLRLVRPREDWPNEKARAAAAGADLVIDRARLFGTTGEAVADLRHLYAATARRRDMVKPVLSPKAAAGKLHAFLDKAEPSGVLFGPERTGLDNDDIALADAVLEVPLNPAYASLNLAQAVLIVAYEFYQAQDVAPEVNQGRNGVIAATKDELLGFFEHLEGELDAGGFLIPPEKRPHMVRNIRNIFQRGGLTEQEVRTLRGMITSLASRRGRKGG